jgi:hypothetical protein
MPTYGRMEGQLIAPGSHILHETMKSCCNFVLCQLFTIVADRFSCGSNSKETARWAQEIFYTFLSEQAVSTPSVLH